jgi:hypothetical protein
MFTRFPRANPTNVILASLAILIPESIAAAIEATIGKPALAALKTISPVSRPLKARKQLSKLIPSKMQEPIVLSTAL